MSVSLGKWHIEVLSVNSDTAAVAAKVEDTKGFFVDYPLMYGHLPLGSMGYDFPERVPQYIKDRTVKECIKALDRATAPA